MMSITTNREGGEPHMMRASSYENKKKERKVQVSMSEEEAKAIAEGDKDTTKQLREAFTQVLVK